jgi:hypothetical protein
MRSSLADTRFQPSYIVELMAVMRVLCCDRVGKDFYRHENFWIFWELNCFKLMDTRITKMNFIDTLPSHDTIELLHKVNIMWRSLFHLPSG